MNTRKERFIKDANKHYAKMVEYANKVTEGDAKIKQAELDGMHDQGARAGSFYASTSAIMKDLVADNKFYSDRVKMHALMVNAACAMSKMDE